MAVVLLGGSAVFAAESLARDPTLLVHMDAGASLEISYSTPHGYSELAYSLECDPLSGSIREPAAACAAIDRDPGMVLSESGNEHSCPPSPAVNVIGRYHQRWVLTSFSPCVSAPDPAALGRWLAFLPSAAEEQAVQIDHGLGLLHLGESAARVRALLGPPKRIRHDLDVYEPYTGISGCLTGENYVILAVGYDRRERVATLISDTRDLTIAGKQVAYLTNKCQGYGEPIARGPLKKWRRIRCAGRAGLVDHTTRSAATIILLGRENPTVMVSRNAKAACAASVGERWS